VDFFLTPVYYEDFIVEIRQDMNVIGTFRNDSKCSALSLNNEIKNFVEQLAVPGKKFEPAPVLDF